MEKKFSDTWMPTPGVRVAVAHTGGIPTIMVAGKTIPEVWEAAVIACWNEGCVIRTEYDKPEDPPSRDCTMIMVMTEPLAEPRIHRVFPGGLEDLEVYRQEVVNGVHDHWVDLSLVSTKWHYTYHDRFTAYGREPGFLLTGFGQGINQLEYVVEKLVETPYTRRALASTWRPWLDPQMDDSPCVQYVWFRILDGRLVMDVHIRSNDAFKAAFMNMFAFTDLQRVIAERVSQRRGEQIGIGQACWIADSFHIYGSYFKDFEGFLKSLRERSFEERTWTSDFAEPFFQEGRERLAREQEEERK